MKYLLIIGLFCSVPGPFAMSDPATGMVLDAETRKPMPFANIVVLGQQKGSVSNMDGYFVLVIDSLAPGDIILFSYMGYETLRIPAAELSAKSRIYLHPTTVNIREVEVLYRSLSAREIVAMAARNLKKNHPSLTSRQQLFFHRYTKVPTPDKNQITLVKSDFAGLDKQTFDEVLSMMPNEFIDNQDAIVEWYSDEKDHRLVPKAGISLEEESMQTLGREMEQKLGTLFEDIEQSHDDDEVYYKFRSGIISQKFKKDSVNDLIWEENKLDTLSYTVSTGEVRDVVLQLLEEYSMPKSKNWEFINDRSKYIYVKEEVTSYHDELLVLDRERMEPGQIENIAEPPFMKFRKEYAYTPEMWENRTVIVPTDELKKYKRR